MSYYVVFQNKTYQEEYELGILWAPQHSSNGGKPPHHWERMKELKKGDIVFSIVKNKVTARGIITREAISSNNPFNNAVWEIRGWLARVQYDFKINNIKISDYIEEIRPYLQKKYYPFVPETGRGVQGYLFGIPFGLGEIIDDLIGKKSSVLTTSEEMESIIGEVFREENIDFGEVILVETERPKGMYVPVHKFQKDNVKKIDFINKAKRDQLVGLKGEELVVIYEKAVLLNCGREDLSDRVKWVSKESDADGYDVLSFTSNGELKYIEVKTTTINDDKVPFIITKNELETSKQLADNYFVYRVYDLNSENPKFYTVNGSIEDNFDLEAVAFKADLKN
jgi:hypothetical protein